MATTLKLRTDIKKLKGALSSKGLPVSVKAKLKAQLDKAQNELKAMQSGAKPRKVSTTKGTQTALSSLQKLINKKKFGIYKGKGIDLKKDADEGALPIGRRISKGLKGNQFGDKKSSKGHVYYEYRANRLDVKQPKGKQKYPKLEDGGMMAKGGEITYSMSSGLRKYYMDAFPSDDYGKRINSKITFRDLKKALEDEVDNIYDFIGVGDSIVRERLFSKLADIMNVNYDVVYEMWMPSGWAKGGKTQGYDDREDERLGMEHGKMSSKDLDSTHARRDDARFEERMAKGGKTKTFYEVVYVDKDDSKKVVAKFIDKNEAYVSANTFMEKMPKVGKTGIYKVIENTTSKFEQGGMMANGGELNDKQKLILELHETLEKALKLIMEIYPDTQEEFDKLPWNTRENLIATRKAIYDALSHRFMSGFEQGGMMAKGGVTEKEVVESNNEMVLSQIKAVKHHADELSNIVNKKSDIEAWVVAKIERASTDLSDITHYLDGQHEKMSMGGTIHNYVHKMDKK